MAHTQPVIQIDHVSFAFNGHIVLQDVHLTVPNKDFLCMVETERRRQNDPAQDHSGSSQTHYRFGARFGHVPR